MRTYTGRDGADSVVGQGARATTALLRAVEPEQRRPAAKGGPGPEGCDENETSAASGLLDNP